MKVLFTTTSLPTSWLIRWVFDEPVSHCAVEFDNGVVLHSDFTGVHIESAQVFRKRNQIVHTLYPSTRECKYKTKTIFRELLEQYTGKSYDYRAFVYLGLRGLLYKLFRIPYPRHNLWARNDYFLCTEFLTTLTSHTEDGLVSPYQLYRKLLLTDDWKE